MKPTAYILSILMLFLVAQPLLVNCQLRAQLKAPKTCCAKSMHKGCDKKDTKKKSESKDCDRTTGCNPFAGCSQCQYITVSKFFYSSGFEQISAKRIPSLNEKTQSGYGTNCWQPPELVFA
jgi:hypothetical protein